MNFDVQICHTVNYRIVNNVFARLCSVVGIGFYIICRFVGKHIFYLANLNYKNFIFAHTSVSLVIHIHRFVSLSRSFETPQKAVLTRFFLVVNNSRKYILHWQ